jgi:hypothetical protein
MEAGERTSDTLFSVALGWSPDLTMVCEFVGVMFSAIMLLLFAELDLPLPVQVQRGLAHPGVVPWPVLLRLPHQRV